MNVRRLLINTVHNMREMGGYSTLEGRATAWRRFIRSDAPMFITAQDAQFLYDYGIRTVIDLRHLEESAWQPSILSATEGITFHNISFTDDFSLLGNIQFCPKDHLVPVMQGQHRAAEVLRAMVNAEDGGVLFYCFGGKDRTGIIAALLLMLADVPVPDIMADYQVTYTYIQPKLVLRNDDIGGRPPVMGERKGKRPEHLRRTEPEWILPFIEYVNGFGGVKDFMRSMGLMEEEIERLRERILD
jgi:protein-tyrosine phosphatase